jgi:hypothetical protein
MSDAVKKGASFNPDDFITGGLLDDVDVTFKNVKCEMFDYGGKSAAAPAVGIDLVTGAETDGEAPYRQHWTVGSAENWEPAPDGKSMVPIGKDPGFRKGSNIHLMLMSLKDAGFPMERLTDGNITTLEGLVAHVVRKPAPKRPNLNKRERTDADGKAYEDKILLIESIVSLPWETEKASGGTVEPKPKAGKGKAKAEAKAETKAAAPEAGDADEKAKTILMQLVVENGGKILKKDVPSLALKILGNDPLRNAILRPLFMDTWITANGFTLSGEGEITLG